MAEVQTFSCDVCEKLKEKTNHWWIVFVTSGAVHISDWHHGAELGKFLLKSGEIIVNEYHICGLEHLTQKISELTSRIEMKVVVSQYQDFVNYCLQINLIEEGQYILIPRVADHAEIRDCDVIGVLPLHLASLCNTITEVPLVIPPELRGKKLNLDQIKEYARKPKTYIVELLNDDELREARDGQ